MSSKIHKSLGYGLNLNNLDYDVDRAQIRSAIYNEEINLAKELENFYHDTVDEKFFKEDFQFFMLRYYLKELQNKNETGNLWQYIQYDDEFGAPNIIQFIPTCYIDRWKRYDDDIDYAQFKHENDDYSAQIEWKNFALHPFMELMKKNDKAPFGVEYYIEPLYLDKYRNGELSEVSIPQAPIEIMGMMHILGVFPKDKLVDTFLQLRPCVYTYWS